MVLKKLPSELEEEILIRVPVLSLVRFRCVCKKWNALFSVKRFANNHLACARPQFLLKTESNIYSISVNLLNDDPIVKVSDLSFDLPNYTYGNCDGYLIFNNDLKGIRVVCNPWLRQTKRIDQLYMDKNFTLCGIGYDSSKPEKSYKIFGVTSCIDQPDRYYLRYAMFELETNAWKLIDHVQHLQETSTDRSFPGNNVSLNGNVYWTAFDQETRRYFIRVLDFSKEIIKPFCIIPGEKKDSAHPYALAVYKGDRFSFLEQCHFTRKIEIWVTKNKISNGDDGDAVVWINFMTVSIPDFSVYDQYRSSCYLVDNNIYGKTFVMCCSDGTNSQASVYVVIGDLCKRIKIDDVVAWFYRFSVYVPSLIPITLDEEN